MKNTGRHFHSKLSKFICAIFLSTAMILSPYSTAHSESQNLTPDWTIKNKFIAHALGGIENDTYSNSLEAFTANYNSGYRVFETDLIFTIDDVLVAKHDWADSSNQTENPLSYSAFMSVKIKGKYTPLSFDDIAKLMQEYKDIYLITDTKELDEANVTKVFQYIYKTAQRMDTSILDRIIPQIYYQNMLQTVKNIYDFKDIIYTLYQSKDNDDEVVEFAVENRISIITMPTNRCSKEFSEKLKRHNILVYTHTINNLDEINNYRNIGVYGFYSDFIKPN